MDQSAKKLTKILHCYEQNWKSNSGEGGEDPKRFQKEVNGDSKIALSNKLRRDVLVFLSTI
jgi:glutamate synthase domain-containing protein 2